MNWFGLPEHEVRELVALVRPAPVAGDGEDRPRSAAGPVAQAVAEAFALATWTVIAEPADELAGALIESIGAATALKALIADRSAAAIAADVRAMAGDVSVDRLRAGLARWRPRVSARAAVLAIEQAARFECRLLLPGDAEWPPGLADLGERAPHAMWARGRAGRFGLGVSDVAPVPEAVAVVGARAATGYGEHVATELAAGLVDRDVVVVSGGAYGIDGAAHRGALAGEGTTVAVLAGGLDRLYPAGHESLLRRVATNGVLLAEVPCGTPPTRFRFLQRNRLIAAIAASVVVVEAGARSGSLNTAGHAAEIGRPIGAVPGPITSAASAGCHRLLREFPATCVTSVDDVLELHRGESTTALPDFDRRSLEELRVLDALAIRRGRDAAEVGRLSGLGEAAARVLLGRLELDGAARRASDGWIRAAAG